MLPGTLSKPMLCRVLDLGHSAKLAHIHPSGRAHTHTDTTPHTLTRRRTAHPATTPCPRPADRATLPAAHAPGWPYPRGATPPLSHHLKATPSAVRPSPGDPTAVRPSPGDPAAVRPSPSNPAAVHPLADGPRRRSPLAERPRCRPSSWSNPAAVQRHRLQRRLSHGASVIHLDELVGVGSCLSDSTTPGLFLQGGSGRELVAALLESPRIRPAKGHAGEADLGRAGGGAEACLRVPAGVRHGGSGARRGAWSCVVAARSSRVGEFIARFPPVFG